MKFSVTISLSTRLKTIFLQQKSPFFNKKSGIRGQKRQNITQTADNILVRRNYIHKTSYQQHNNWQQFARDASDIIYKIYKISLASRAGIFKQQLPVIGQQLSAIRSRRERHNLQDLQDLARDASRGF